MMSTPNGYNNPAYCHQYESSLYDYQYVPEIDPDSPNLREESNRKTPRTKLVHPNFLNSQREPSDSSEFEGSDESNRSIIIEECNNRRVTLICEKRNKTDVGQDEFDEDGHFRGAYYQDISLESENGYESQENRRLYDAQKISLRHQRALEPPVEHVGISTSSNTSNNDGRISRNPSFKEPTASIRSYQRPQRHHRYEEISFGEDCLPDESKPSKSVHRYAEITVDENGYPTLSKEIKVEQGRDCYRQKINHPPKVISKPRAISPVNYPKSFSPPPTPNRTPQKTLNELDFSIPRFSPNSPSSFIYSSSPVKTNSIEMSELSPPRLSSEVQLDNQYTLFINSPKRQPPIGASAASDSRETFTPNGRCILPKTLQQNITRRCQSQPNSPRRQRDLGQAKAFPGKMQSNKKIPQIFHINSSQSKYKSNTRAVIQNENTPVRRNISNYFSDCPAPPKSVARSPYKPTTAEINPAKTAIITPIFPRKNQQNHETNDSSLSPKRNFEKMSQAFQSTGNLLRNTREAVYSCDTDFPSRTSQKQLTRIKRNQSVPNFSQTLAAETGMISRKIQDAFDQGNDKYSRNLDLQYSPKKPLEHLSSIDKSRISLIDQTSSWSNLNTDYHPRCSACFIFAALVHLTTASATCAISFYLLSKVGRKYYLDFGLLAGFVNFILGLLGFRSYCWRWLPNRNYVSGFIGLAAFSALTCAGLTYLVTARPMAGDPILDIMGGAICAVSVLTIALALTGLTMSGCCKAPPPDNRVTDI